MVDVTTSDAIAVPVPANDTVNPGVLEPPNLESSNEDQRHERILLLREAIEGGEYGVSASQLADAILRTARCAN